MTNKIEKIILIIPLLGEIALRCVFCIVSRKSPATELFQLPSFPPYSPCFSSEEPFPNQLYIYA